MVDHFASFALIVQKSFRGITKDNTSVFVTDIDADALYQAYLAAFPEGTNPTFRNRTEHDCSCCRQFIRHVGNVVAIVDGTLVTIWDKAASDAPAPYNVVAASLRDLVKNAKIRDLFRVNLKEMNFGAKQSVSLHKETQRTERWSHFYTEEIFANLRVASPDQVRGDYRTTVQVFERGLRELSTSALNDVLELITQNSLYRGEEHKTALTRFRTTQKKYLAITNDRQRDLYLWANANDPSSRFRNTVIGTLVQDLSEGREIEVAVKSFETKVAPTNYKRTTALITPSMIKNAMKMIEELGLEPALDRRFATINDISVNDVKWVDGSVKPLMRGGIADVLMQVADSNKSPIKEIEKAEIINLDDFVSKILPDTTSMEILFKNELAGNLMSLTAPVNPDPKQLFRWNNDFAWSYGGNVADSIKERVKKAGGKIHAVMRVSLSWFNYDDLDLHIVQPKSRSVYALADTIYFGNKQGWSGGILDVDMNAGSGTTREPVENIAWSKTPPDGSYKVVVNNYSFRESSNPGFVVEIENNGKITQFAYNKIVSSKKNVNVATLDVKDGIIQSIESGDNGITVGSSSFSQELWGIKTEQFAKVTAVTLSPNYWGDNAVGNKHTFFVLDKARNEEPTRGFYNEFLHSRLEQHRKVFEVIGEKTKCVPTEGQLSGLGFSSTKKETFIARVYQGKKQRIFNVQVGV